MIKMKIGLISGVSLLLGILFNYFFYENNLGISFLLYIILIIGGLFFITHILKKKISKKLIYLLIPLIFFSMMVVIRTSLLLTFLNIVVSVFLLLLIAGTFYGEKVKNFLMRDYIKVLFLPFKFLASFFSSFSQIFSSYKANKNQKVLHQVIKGLVIAVPIVFVFILLFSSADLIFKKYTIDLFSLNIQPEIIFRAILSLVVTFVFIGAYSYIFQETEVKKEEEVTKKTFKIGGIESSIVLGSLNIVFFLFILVQLTYLFGGESNISVQGFTYAEYARKGFFELIAVAVLSLLLLLTFEKYITRKKKNHTFGFKMLSVTMIVQVIVIIVSAFMRLSLYENAYGFTTLRLYSHAFIILLAVVFCLLVYKIYRNTKENSFALQIFISVILFLVGMNFINPDLFIARQNIQKFANTEEFDIYYLSNLSDDAIPEMVKVLDLLEGDIKNRLGYELYLRGEQNEKVEEWQSFNISRMRARKIINFRIEELEEYKSYEGDNLEE